MTSDPDPYTVVVTGGSRGIGRAICLAFSRQGANVYFNYSSSKAAADETEALSAREGVKATGLRADIQSEEALTGFFKTVRAETGRIDVLVNNAGISRDQLVVRMKISDWDDVMSTNLKGAFMCTKIASRTMLKQRKGRILNISSIVGVTGNPGQANYAASKSGLIGLTKSTAKELASRNITVNAIAPGFIETDMTDSLTEEVRMAILNQIPMGRLGSPEDVAAVAVFLASPEADYITGQVVHVSGGMYI